MRVVLRSVTLGFALSVLAAACALVEPPVPPGTFALLGEVRNAKAGPVQVEVRTPAGAVPGAVQPAVAPAHATTKVTFYIPLAGDWSIWADDEHLIEFDRSRPRFANIRRGMHSRDRGAGRRRLRLRMQLSLGSPCRSCARA